MWTPYTPTHLHAYTSPRLHAYTPTRLQTYTPTHPWFCLRAHTYLHAYTPTRTWAFLTSEHGLFPFMILSCFDWAGATFPRNPDLGLSGFRTSSFPLYDLIMFRLAGSHFSSRSGPGPFWLPKPLKFKDFLHLAETPWRRRNPWSCSPLHAYTPTHLHTYTPTHGERRTGPRVPSAPRGLCPDAENRSILKVLEARKAQVRISRKSDSRPIET